jgi:BRCT domain type II-containing protein
MKKIFKISLLLVATLLSACRSSSSSEHSEKLVSSSSEKTSEVTSSSSESSSSTAFRILDTVKNIRIENNYLMWDAVTEATHYNVMVGSTGAEYERKTVYDAHELDLMTL